LVDLLQAVEQLVVVVTAHLIATDEFVVQTVQPLVILTHPVSTHPVTVVAVIIKFRTKIVTDETSNNYLLIQSSSTNNHYQYQMTDDGKTR